ncbi:hypothetical protein ADL26_08150, partial [Thermoactinomyces vulgaris]
GYAFEAQLAVFGLEPESHAIDLDSVEACRPRVVECEDARGARRQPTIGAIYPNPSAGMAGDAQDDRPRVHCDRLVPQLGHARPGHDRDTYRGFGGAGLGGHVDRVRGHLLATTKPGHDSRTASANVRTAWIVAVVLEVTNGVAGRPNARSITERPDEDCVQR